MLSGRGYRGIQYKKGIIRRRRRTQSLSYESRFKGKNCFAGKIKIVSRSKKFREKWSAKIERSDFLHTPEKQKFSICLCKKALRSIFALRKKKFLIF
ncbi:Uncharacterized protein dnm_087610 [Desulfonema magnum]|uniref:Uncharacterized protein n=1 Tax=Desulfonema magnum TaxID=45655 RepID=A0A975BVV3_9BACT|nr:Uncharacterized protein dnm_087610 [Desulfonema magnum]